MIISESSIIPTTKYTLIQRTNDYKEYLRSHIEAVIQTYNVSIKPYLSKQLSSSQFGKLYNLIRNHDKSKYSKEEWTPYLDKYYYGSNKSIEQIYKNYKYALLHHKYKTPHHWQYRLNITDKQIVTPLSMDFYYIIEVLCDWHSFSAKDLQSTAYSWYKDHNDKFILSLNTKVFVNKMINLLKVPLTEVMNNG